MRFRLGSIRRSRWATRRWATAASATVVVVLALVGVTMTGVFAGSGAGAAATGRGAASGAVHPAARPAARPAAPTAAHDLASVSSAQSRPAGDGHRGGLRTSCRSTAHIGDSTSVDLTATGGDITDPAQQLPDRYADVGVKHLLLDASGGRSIVEEMPGQVNGYDVAQNWWHQGYRGCWVFALGTNDTANVSAGSGVGMMARIQEMMSVAHGEPVMWVNTVTQLDSGAWSQANEQAWDNTLVSALAKYPNMRIFNWASVAQPGWFLPDGIHYNPVGCAARAQAIADALARAFPRYGHSHGQIVR
jgi:hypothetical protein